MTRTEHTIIMRGRKPHPTWRRMLQGNPGGRAMNASEPAPPAPAPDFDAPPDELKDDARAIAEWQRVAPMLRKARQISEADRSTLIALCIEWSRYVNAIKQIAVEGLIVTNGTYAHPSPYVTIARNALIACGRLWPELGMTPSSRARVKTTAAPADAFSEFDEPAGAGIAS